jgi:uncharacterized protein (DUF305 family)
MSEEEAQALADPTYSAEDVAFVQNMIPHHRQALQMTALVADRTDRADLPQLAERMDVSQQDEMTLLEGWLQERGEAVPSEHHEHTADHAAQMPGMLTEAEMAHLEAANGARFDRLFLQYMIRHHEGAVIMVQDLIGRGGGQEPAVFQLAQHIGSDQQVEIARMKALLTQL